MSEPTYSLMRDIPPAERPRERLQHYGSGALGIAELLAIILRSGTGKVSAVRLAEQLVQRFSGLRGLATATVEELATVPGIGPAKACELKAAFELGKRLATTTDAPRPVVSSPLDAANLLMEEMRYLHEEHYRVLFLDTRNGVIKALELSIGTLNMSVVHPRETFRAAISAGAHSIIVAHNHPSGDPSPSAEDLALTARLKQAGEVIGIPVIDHLIVGDGRYVSLSERNLL
jgi:DNA repair protein RadC